MIICAVTVGDTICSSVYLLSVKPSQPVLIVRGSTANSIDVTWNSTFDGDCRLRYRANGTQVWTKVCSLTLNYLFWIVSWQRFMSKGLLDKNNLREKSLEIQWPRIAEAKLSGGACLDWLAWKTKIIPEIKFLDCFQVADTVPARKDQILTYIIKGLLPFTVYGAAVACRGGLNIWSHWSFEVTARTQDMSN